jgi:hypothetical protein
MELVDETIWLSYKSSLTAQRSGFQRQVPTQSTGFLVGLVSDSVKNFAQLSRHYLWILNFQVIEIGESN